MDFTRRKFLATTGLSVGLLSGCMSSKPEGDAPDSLSQPTLGNTEANIPVMELFEDYGCPHCLTFEQSYMPKIMDDFVKPEKLYIKYYDFPLPVRQLSKEAAIGGRVVQHKGGNEAFWKYKSSVMQEQKNMDFSLFKTAANNVGVNGDEVVKQIRSGEWDVFVEEDKKYGKSQGINGTPGIIVAGKQIQLGPYQNVANQIQEVLDKQ